MTRCNLKRVVPPEPKELLLDVAEMVKMLEPLNRRLAQTKGEFSSKMATMMIKTMPQEVAVQQDPALEPGADLVM